MCPNAVNTIFVYYSGRTVNSQTSALEMLVWCCWCWRLLLLPFLCKLLLLVLFRLLVFYSPFLCSPSHAHSLCPSFVAVISLCAPNKRYICTCASHLLLCIALYVLCVNKASFIVVADIYIYMYYELDLWVARMVDGLTCICMCRRVRNELKESTIFNSNQRDS